MSKEERNLYINKQHPARAVTSELRPLNTLRLGLALKFSAFQREVKEDTPKACQIALEALRSAAEEVNILVEHLSSHLSKDSTSMMQLLRDDETKWKCGEYE